MIVHCPADQDCRSVGRPVSKNRPYGRRVPEAGPRPDGGAKGDWLSAVTALEVILVHGLYHQPQHMQPLRTALEERGAIVHVPRLHRGSLTADTEAGTFIPPVAAAELFYADCDPQEAQRAVDLLVPQASGHGRGVVETAPWERAISHYIVCSNDRAMSPALQLRMAMRCSSHEVLRASHSPYISRPQQVATSVLDSSAVR